MLVQVKQFSSEDCWYTEMVGEKFIGFRIPNNPYIFVTAALFFYPQDIELCNDHSGTINFGLIV